MKVPEAFRGAAGTSAHARPRQRAAYSAGRSAATERLKALDRFRYYMRGGVCMSCPRQERERLEHFIIGPNGVLSENSRGRLTPEDECDIRTCFQRDVDRITHSKSFRRLKHKTQVFFAPSNDHICTRIEHVTHVESISYTIAKYLGLNTELTKAIAVAHDIGHSPFGHEGERILSIISKRDLGYSFWHEKNGLEFVDNIELLEDNNKYMQNLDLTYAVRDGIISHCGEIDENCLFPRNEFIDLKDYDYPNKYAPYTWEGCAVKISD